VESAVALVRRAWQRDPGDFVVTCHLANWLAKLGGASVLRFAEAAVALRPTSPAAWHALAHAYAFRDDYTRADRAFRRAMRLAPRTPNHLVCFASSLSRRGQHAEATTLARRAIGLDPTWGRAFSVLGEVLVAQGEIERGVDAHQEAVRTAPEDGSTHIRLALALLRGRDPAGAIAAAREAVRLEPRRAEFHHTLGSAFSENGDLDEAAAAFREAIRLDPDLAGSWSMLGSVLLDLGDVEGAEAACRKAARIEPNCGHFVNLSRVLLRRKDWDGAIEAAREAVSLAPTDKSDLSKALTNLGNALDGKGDIDGAIAKYREAIDLDPDNAVTWYSLGNLMLQMNEVDEAIAAFEGAIRADPTYAEAYCNRAMALREAGRFAEALESVRKGHALGSRRRDWRYPSADWVKTGERLADLERRLPEIVAQDPPQVAGECKTIGWVLLTKKRFADAARFYDAALELAPTRADTEIYLVAYVGVLAATPEWRGRALHRLRELLERWDTTPALARKNLELFKSDPDLAAVRDRVDELPEGERAEWRRFWADVDALLARAVAK
jgi:tetratricopeptide (TPR) repeat protein